MPARKLSYQVDVDSSDAVRDLRRLGDAGRDAGDDLKAGFDDAESAATKALRAISQEADRMESELKGTGDAVKAIGAELGDGFDASKIERMVGDLRRMGVTFDEIEANAKEFADVVQRVDGIRLDAVNSGLTNVDESMRRVGDSADQSRSVLANMAGNVAQDLGAVGGAVGSLGVGIGQLAEYAVDGNISLQNLAKVAGPLAGLTALGLGVQTITKGLADLRAAQAAYTKQQADFNQAVDESGSVVGTLNDLLRENTELVSQPELNWWQSMLNDLPFVGRAIDETALSTTDLTQAMADAGITAEEWINAVRVDVPDAAQKWIALGDKITAAGEAGEITDEQLQLLTDQLGAYSTLTSRASSASDVFTTSTAGVNQALQDNQDQLSLTSELWDVVLRDLSDGAGLIEAETTPAWNRLKEILVATDDEMAAMAQSKLDEQLADQAAQAQQVADALGAAAEQARGLQQAARDYQTITTTNDWGRAGLEGAATAFETYFTSVHGHHNDVIAQEEAWDSLGSAIDTAGTAIIDLSGPEGRATFEALQELGRSYIPAIAKAFDESDGDIDTFKRSMDDLAQTTLRRLQDEFGLSADDAGYLVDAMGLIPDDIETTYKLAGDEEARVKLGLLQGVIDGLPEEVQTEVAMHILADDPQAALAAVERAVSGGVTAPMYLDTSPAMRAYNALVAAIGAARIIAALTLTTSGARSTARSAGVPVPGSATPMMLGATPAASGFAGGGGGGVAVLTAPAPVTNNYRVEVKAAVIGDQHAARRWVTRALRQSDRLGSRP